MQMNALQSKQLFDTKAGCAACCIAPSCWYVSRTATSSEIQYCLTDKATTMPFGRPLQTYRGKHSKEQRADEEDWYYQSNKHAVVESVETIHVQSAKCPLSAVHISVLSSPP